MYSDPDSYPHSSGEPVASQEALEAAVALVRDARGRLPMGMCPARWRAQITQYQEAVELLAVHAEQNPANPAGAPASRCRARGGRGGGTGSDKEK